MKLRWKKTGEILDVPEGAYRANPDMYEPVETPKAQPQIQAEQPKQNILGQLLDVFAKKTGENVVSPTLNTLGQIGDYIKYQTAQTPQAKLEAAKSYTEKSKAMEDWASRVGFATKETPYFDPGKLVQETGKTALEAGSYAVPFGKGAGIVQRSLLPGATSGVMRGLSEDDATLGSVAGAGVTGAVTAGVLDKVLGLGKVATKTGQALEKGLIKPQVRVGPTMVSQEEKIAQAAKEFGLSGIPGQRLAQVDELYKGLSSNLDDVLSQSTAKASSETIKTAMRQKLTDMGLTGAQYDDIVNASLNRIGAGDVTAKSISALKSTIGKELPSKVWDMGPSTASQEVRYAMWQALDDVLTGIEPGAKAITSKMSKLYDLAPGLAKGRAATVPIPLTGIRVGAAPVQAVQDITAKGLQATGQGLEPILEAAKGLQKPATAAAIGMRGGQEATPQIPQEMTPEPQYQEEITQPDKTTEALKKITMMQVLDLAQGGKNISKLEAIKKAIQTMSPEGTMSAADKAVVNQAKQGLNLVDVLENQYSKVQQEGLTAGSPGLGILGGVRGSAAALSQTSPNAAAYENTKQAFLSKLARASGEKGVLTDQDIKRIEKTIPSFYDTPDTAAAKLAIVRQIIGDAITAKTQASQTGYDLQVTQ